MCQGAWEQTANSVLRSEEPFTLGRSRVLCKTLFSRKSGEATARASFQKQRLTQDMTSHASTHASADWLNKEKGGQYGEKKIISCYLKPFPQDLMHIMIYWCAHKVPTKH